MNEKTGEDDAEQKTEVIDSNFNYKLFYWDRREWVIMNLTYLKLAKVLIIIINHFKLKRSKWSALLAMSTLMETLVFLETSPVVIPFVKSVSLKLNNKNWHSVLSAGPVFLNNSKPKSYLRTLLHWTMLWNSRTY